MNHEKQIETLCRIVALMIRRLLTENAATSGPKAAQELEDESQSNG